MAILHLRLCVHGDFFVSVAGESLQSLSAEQLQQLEGMERANVEARIAVLRDVQKLLDSAVLRLNQYSTVMAVIRCVIAILLYVSKLIWLHDFSKNACFAVRN